MSWTLGSSEGVVSIARCVWINDPSVPPQLNPAPTGDEAANGMVVANDVNVIGRPVNLLLKVSIFSAETRVRKTIVQMRQTVITWRGTAGGDPFIALVILFACGAAVPFFFGSSNSMDYGSIFCCLA